MQTAATYDSEAGTFTLTKGTWSGTFPIDDLPKCLAFYRRQQELFPDHAASYGDDVGALEVLTAQIPRSGWKGMEAIGSATASAD